MPPGSEVILQYRAALHMAFPDLRIKIEDIVAESVAWRCSRNLRLKVSKGTIRFPLSQPVPVKLIGDIARFRASEGARLTKRPPR